MKYKYMINKNNWNPIETLPKKGTILAFCACRYMDLQYMEFAKFIDGSCVRTYLGDMDTFVRSKVIAWHPVPDFPMSFLKEEDGEE